MAVVESESNDIKKTKLINSDAVAILYSMRRHHKRQFAKQRFLLGLSDSPELNDEEEESQAAPESTDEEVEGSPDASKLVDENAGSPAAPELIVQEESSHKVSMLPESFLRKDDLFYEDLKELVEKGSGSHVTVTRQLNNVKLGDLNHISSLIETSLDDFSNHGLYNLTKVVTKDSTFCKTRTEMKKVIKRGLSDILSNQSSSYNQVKIHSELCHILQNSKNFCHNSLPLSLETQQSILSNFINELTDLSFPTLIAVYRKLSNVRGYVPRLRPPKSAWNKVKLVSRVTRMCSEMTHQLGEINELPEPLAKAMTVVALSNRVKNGPKNTHEVDFDHATSEIEALQNEIVKAIRSLEQKVKKEDMQKLQQILDPESKVDSKGLKTAIKNMLMEFLFECRDMEVIPDSLLKAISLINKTPCRLFSKESVNEEVECVLNVGASLKQILWDFVPDCELDQDFADTYMEELEDSDDGLIFDDDALIFNGGDSEYRESVGDATFDDDVECLSTVETLASSFEAATFDDGVECSNGVSQSDPSMSPSGYEQKDISRNKYVSLQEVADRTSVVAYRLIDYLLQGLEKGDDDPLIVEAVRQVIPSFPDSEMEKVRKYMNS